MYRQILAHPDDCNHQRILHRTNPTRPIKDLTFGVNCSPYLAIRTLIKLAQVSGTTHANASHIIQKETYVDDILSSGHGINSAVASLAQLNNLLELACFPLRKITSNSSHILKSVSKEPLLDTEFLKFLESSSTKTLGIQWNAISDTFSYRVLPLTQSKSTTKIIRPRWLDLSHNHSSNNVFPATVTGRNKIGRMRETSFPIQMEQISAEFASNLMMNFARLKIS